jgi:hypothetical protein
MHGQNVASGNSGTFALNSPLLALANGGSMRRSVSAIPFPVEAHFSMQPFALRRRELAFRPVPAAGSTFPAYIFETIMEDRT